jgi:hypothetical protein
VNHVASTNDTDFSGVFPKSHFFLAQM